MKTFAHLGVFPVYRDNPYLNLMLLAPRAAGWDVVEMTKLEHVEEQLARFAPGDVFHMHWTSPIVQREDAEADARARLDRFRSAVDGAKERGVGIVWTIHNVLPHDARHLDLEIELNQYLAAAADTIHVMNRATAEVVAPYYTLDPGRTVRIPHPSYQGVYSSSMTRAEARASFELADDDHAILFFGQMRPYKGLDVLTNAVSRLDPALRPVLMLAGRASADDRARIEGLLPRSVRTVQELDHVNDADVERWFRAADVAVFPYRQVLTSGAMHLAATYELATIVPDEAHLESEFSGENWVHYFRAADAVEGVQSSIARSFGGLSGADAMNFSARLAPFALSRRYADLLASVHGLRKASVSPASA